MEVRAKWKRGVYVVNGKTVNTNIPLWGGKDNGDLTAAEYKLLQKYRKAKKNDKKIRKYI